MHAAARSSIFIRGLVSTIRYPLSVSFQSLCERTSISSRSRKVNSPTTMMRLTDAIQARAGEPYHTFEFFPPRTPEGLANLLDRIQRLTSAPLSPPIAVSVTWGAGGSTATRSLELAAEIAKLELARGKLQIILHLTCTNMGKKMVDEALKVSIVYSI
jgi:hypothetical protein